MTHGLIHTGSRVSTFQRIHGVVWCLHLHPGQPGILLRIALKCTIPARSEVRGENPTRTDLIRLLPHTSMLPGCAVLLYFTFHARHASM